MTKIRTDIPHLSAFTEKYFYFRLYRADVRLYIEFPTLDLGIYQDGVFVSLLNLNQHTHTEKLTYHPVPKIKMVLFLDALYRASKNLEPFLSISTRLFKLILDDYQDKAETLELSPELYRKIKTMYWGVLQENATEELIENGFRIVMEDAMKLYTKEMLREISP